MKTYRVYFHFSHAGYYDIEAEDAEDAGEIAETRFTDEEEPTYHFQGAGGFEVLSVEEQP